MANCLWCGAPFEDKASGGFDRLYCSGAHKQAAYRQRHAIGGGVKGTQAEVDHALAEARAIGGGSYRPLPPGSPAFDRQWRELANDAVPVSDGLAVKSMVDWLRTGVDERKALVEDTAGTIMVPPQVELDIATVARQTGYIRELASVRPTASNKQRAGMLGAATTGWGRLETGTGITDAAIAVGSPAQDIDVWDVLALSQIGADELDDTVNAAATIAEAIGISIAEAEDAAFASGSGTNQPKGLALAANVSRVPAGQKVAAAASATPTAADLVSIPPKLPVKYRQGAVWLASSDMYAKILALLYPATTLMTAAAPLTGPCGYPMYEIPGLPSAATAGTTDPSVWFINLRYAYRVVDRGPVTITRLTQKYAELGLVGILAKRRVGGDLVRPDAACIYTL